jgi:phosphoketolase
MNKINPLHIGALLVVLLAFLFFTLSQTREELVQEKALFAESEKLAVELSSLKDVYANKKRMQKSLERLLAQSSLKSADLNMKKDKKSIKISSKSIDTKALNSLMGKILNASYNVTTLKIKKLSETKASLELEIKW